ncbi:MAG TPA: sigma-70 family RNA polymerase sigma factor [Pirellulales bacterium]|nr:sigma-70 family RNA polymerase sigma factor [Pirellulales bacterium]
MHTTPASLLKRLKQPEADRDWQRFVDLYTPLFFYWARQAGLRPPDDADLVQEVFLILVKKLPEFDYDRRKSFRGWLRTLMTNRLRDHWRRAKVPEAAGAENLLAELASRDIADVDEQEHRRYLLARAAQIVRPEFQESTWQACWRFAFEGVAAAEVARDLGMTENAVYIAKGRVLKRLRAELEGLLD